MEQVGGKRFRSGKWYYRVKHKLLTRPLYVSFEDEARGDAYVAQLKIMLSAGVVPATVAARTMPVRLRTLGDLLREYELAVSLPESDKLMMSTLHDRVGSVPLSIDYKWVDGWVSELRGLAPSTIRHLVGSLSRAVDWLVRTQPGVLAANPLRLLPKRYATHGKKDVERDRRLNDGEEASIRKILAGWHPEDKERGITVDPDITLVFELALETAMRLREIFTLTPDQVQLDRRTVNLDRTKNGDSRQVPLSTVAVKVLADFKGFPWVKTQSQAEYRRVTSLLSRRFGTIFELAGCADLHFHDLRHEAVCRLYERTKFSDVQIARITGHKDLRTLRRYASLRGSDLASGLW